MSDPLNPFRLLRDPITDEPLPEAEQLELIKPKPKRKFKRGKNYGQAIIRQHSKGGDDER